VTAGTAVFCLALVVQQKGGQACIASVPPGLSIAGEYLELFGWNVAPFQDLLNMIAEALLLATWMSTSAKEFPIQYTPRKTVGGHADNVTNPTKLSLHRPKQKFQRFTARFASDFRVGDFMPPAEAENALLARDVEGLQRFDVTSVQCPAFTAV